MENLRDFNEHSHYINESNKPSTFQSFLQNIDRGGDRIQFSRTGDDSTEDATIAFLGNILKSIAKVGKSISRDFGMDWVEDRRDYNYYHRNKRKNIDRWAKENLANNKSYQDSEIEKVYNEFKTKGKKRFGDHYNFDRLDKNATADEKMWSEYAKGILKKYSDTRSI